MGSLLWRSCDISSAMGGVEFLRESQVSVVNSSITLLCVPRMATSQLKFTVYSKTGATLSGRGKPEAL
jgi:hypothetical protein